MKASAPGKIILIGEHSVVYGEPAIISAVGIRTFISARKSANISYRENRFGHNDSWKLNDVIFVTEQVLEMWRECSKSKNFSKLFDFIKSNLYENYKKSVVGIALKELGVNEGVSIDITSELPNGCGMGSSASLAVALIQSIAAEYGKKITKRKINAIAYEIEKIIHGTPSGGDNTICCYGGVIWYRKGHEPENIKQPSMQNFVLVKAGDPKLTTGELVQKVRDIEPSYRGERIKNLGRLAREMKESLQKEKIQDTVKIINAAQKNLKELGVSTDEIDSISDEMISIGGAAKLCGAGGGGMVLCLHKNKQELMEKIKGMKYKPIEAQMGAEGVRIED